jgi:hypothetical protein
MLRDVSGNIIGEAGTVTRNQPDGVTWFTKNLLHTYTEPIVFMQIDTFGGSAPAHVRLKNININSFQYQIEEWDYILNQGHAIETMAYLVIEKGPHHLADGTIIEADKIDTTHEWASVPQFTQSFTSTPVTLSQSQTINEVEAVVTRQRSGTSTGFQVRLQEERGNDGTHAEETIGYFAIEPS